MVSKGRIQPDPTKVEAIQRLVEPNSLRQLRAFLGLVGFYRKFIPHFSRIARPLTELLRDDCLWEWGDSQQAAFEGLKKEIGSTSWLACPEDGGKYRVYTDFSAEGMGAALH